MIIDDDEIITKLGREVDGILAHDRPIADRYDDSVAQVVGGRPRLLRRARGYAPAPIPLPEAAASPLLAVGAQLNTRAPSRSAGKPSSDRTPATSKARSLSRRSPGTPRS
ncbi:hypothetical protein GCM10029992_50010 [Glycomyces albus]